MANRTTARRAAFRALARTAEYRRAFRYANTPGERAYLASQARAVLWDVAAQRTTGRTASGLPL